MTFRDPKTRIKKNFTNKELAESYIEKCNLFNVFYDGSEIDANQFLNELFFEAAEKNILMSDDEFGTFKGNAKMLVYSPSLSRQKYFKKGDKKVVHCHKNVMITENDMSRVNFEGYNEVYTSVNLHYGTKKNSLAYICAIDIDVDEIYTVSDAQRVIDAIEDGSILKPTFLVNTGTGLHFVYRLKNPVYVYSRPHRIPVFQALKSAICKKIEQVLFKGSPYKGKIKPLAFDQKMRFPSTATKVGETMGRDAVKNGQIVRVWEIEDSYALGTLAEFGREFFYEGIWANTKKCSVLSNFQKRECGDDILNSLNDLDKAQLEELKFDSKLVKKAIKTREGKTYRFVNRNLYNGWKKKCFNALVGTRYFAMLYLASCAIKSGVRKFELSEDLKEIQKYLNSVSDEPVTDKDVESVITAYLANPNLRYFKLTIANEICGFETHVSKRNGRTREEHLNRLRALTGRKTKRKELLHRLIELEAKGYKIDKMSYREIAALTGISKTTVATHLRFCIKKMTSKCKEIFKKVSIEAVLDCEKFVENTLNYFFGQGVRKSLLLYCLPWKGLA